MKRAWLGLAEALFVEGIFLAFGIRELRSLAAEKKRDEERRRREERGDSDPTKSDP